MVQKKIKVDALKLKDELHRKFMEKFDGEFTIEKLRDMRKKSILEGRNKVYKSVEEYEEQCRIADAESKS